MSEIMGTNSAKLAGLQIDLLQKFKAGNITLDHIEWFNNLKKSERDDLSGNKPLKNEILRLLSAGETITIAPCDGMQILARAKGTFPSGVDAKFKEWGLYGVGKATEETQVQVYEMEEDATFVKMFGSLGNDLNKLCMTQHQIRAFCGQYPRWLCANGYENLFLFKENGQFFVAVVCVYADGLDVDVFRFGYGCVWNAGRAHRVVVPQLIV